MLQPIPDTLLTLKEAMAYLRVSRSTIYRLLASGTLRGYKVGSTWRFKPVDLARVVVLEEARVASWKQGGR